MSELTPLAKLYNELDIACAASSVSGDYNTDLNDLFIRWKDLASKELQLRMRESAQSKGEGMQCDDFFAILLHNNGKESELYLTKADESFVFSEDIEKAAQFPTNGEAQKAFMRLTTEERRRAQIVLIKTAFERGKIQIQA